MPLNEADTCRVLITPALQKANWASPVWRIAEQHYFTDGQVILVGDGHKRQKGKKADYVLRYEESFPIAVVEAKAEDLEAASGLQQAKTDSTERRVDRGLHAPSWRPACDS